MTEKMPYISKIEDARRLEFLTMTSRTMLLKFTKKTEDALLSPAVLLTMQQNRYA